MRMFRAGSLFVTATTAVGAVRAVRLTAGDVVAISGAAGGVGSLAVQLAQRAGARVLGIASDENAEFLRSVDVEQIAYGDGLADRLKAAAPHGIDAFIDLFGGDYLDLAHDIGIASERIDTIIDFAGAAKHGIKTDGSAAAASPQTLTDVDIEGTVLENDPPRRLVVSWASPGGAGDAAQCSRVTYDVEPLDKSVRLTVTHENLEPESERLNSITFGWPAVLSGLKTLLETGDVEPNFWAAAAATSGRE